MGAQAPYSPPASPYFDPANAQLAQWAYQQMMFNAQQQHIPQQQQDFFSPPPAMHGQFNPFPSGTPPPRPGDAPQQQQYAGFHPYRRPSRQQSGHSESSATPPQDWRPQPPYSRPDASGSSSSVDSQGRPRTNSNNSQGRRSSPSPVPSAKATPSVGAPPPRPHHRNGSSSSTHSAHSAHSSQTSSSPASGSSSTAKLPRPSPLSQGIVAAPQPSARAPNPTSRSERRISRDDSSLALSSLSLLATRADAASAVARDGGRTEVKGNGLKGRLRRALSFNASVALKEEVDAADADAAAGGEDDDGDDSDASIKASVVNPARTAAASSSSAAPAPGRAAVPVGGAQTGGLPAGAQVPMPKKKSRAASLFNSRLNASTDNISLSSTVSSASVMIRKLGSMGRLARRNSLAGITALFKDKKRREDGEEGEGEAGAGEEGDTEGVGAEGKKGKDKDKDKKKDKDKGKKGKEKEKDKDKGRRGKGEASEASVSHATAELEAGDWSVPEAGAGGMTGLSPAAKLARQHTLKSNAEAAAKAKEAAARQAAALANANAGANGAGGVPTWERNTTTRSPGRQRGGVAVAEDGTRVLVEESESDDEGYGPPPSHMQQQQQMQQMQQHQQMQQQQWDDEDDDEWGLMGGEEDDTIRLDAGAQGGEYAEEDGGYGEGYGDDQEPWGTGVRRSVERARQPARGILKHAGTYDQSSYAPEVAGGHNPALRARSNSYNAPPSNELGPLARMPSPDPDHIDGLHRHGSHSSQHGQSSPHMPPDGKRSSVPSLPPLAFDSAGVGFESPQATPTKATYAAAGSGPGAPSPVTVAAPSPMFSHPNSSAPALSTLGLGYGSGAAPLAHRAATAPSKKLAFASNLSVYDTFSASMYDRRSEPATWSRLTPALAQRIKEELNSYKMEEMEVHAASRIHTQFFV